MTTQEALNAIADSSKSNYTGNGSLELYTGWGNASLEFNGGPGANLLDTGDGAEPFVLNVTNAHASARSFYLSQGILYTRGSETAGQLRTGTFAAINDTGTATSLTATTDNSISIEQFLGYCQLNPTYVPLLQLTSTEATNQLKQTFQYYRQGMIKNQETTTIPLRKYAQQGAYNLQFQDIREPLYISSSTIIIINVAGASTLTLNLYPLVSKSTQAELRGDVSSAKQLVAGDPAAAARLNSVQKTAVAALTSQLNSISSRG